jgi:hypothetical protein
MPARMRCLTGLLALAAAIAVSLAPGPVRAQEAPCTYENRQVPHGTIVGVMRCQNGRWYRI